jgi:hypothetical protein
MPNEKYFFCAYIFGVSVGYYPMGFSLPIGSTKVRERTGVLRVYKRII